MTKLNHFVLTTGLTALGLMLSACGGGSGGGSTTTPNPPPGPTGPIEATSISSFSVSTNVGPHRIAIPGGHAGDTFTGTCTPNVAGRSITWSGTGLVFDDPNSESVTITVDSSVTTATKTAAKCTLDDDTSKSDSETIHINTTSVPRFARNNARFGNLDMDVYTRDGADGTKTAGSQALCDNKTIDELGDNVYGAAYLTNGSFEVCYVIAEVNVKIDGVDGADLIFKRYLSGSTGSLAYNGTRYVDGRVGDVVLDLESEVTIPERQIVGPNQVTIGGLPDAPPGDNDVIKITVSSLMTIHQDSDTGEITEGCQVQSTQFHTSLEDYGPVNYGFCGSPAVTISRSTGFQG